MAVPQADGVGPAGSLVVGGDHRDLPAKLMNDVDGRLGTGVQFVDVLAGTDTANSLVLANLPAWEVVLVDGDPVARAETIACMAAELALGPHADHVEVVASGLGAMGADLQAFGVQYPPDVPQAAGAFASRILEAHQDPDDRWDPVRHAVGQ